jgi:hypothetical protein
MAPSGTVRLMFDSGNVILAPELVTDAHFVNKVSVNIDVFLGIGVDDCSIPGLLSKVPAERGLIFPPVELLEVSDMSGLTMESTGLLLGRITMGCS